MHMNRKTNITLCVFLIILVGMSGCSKNIKDSNNDEADLTVQSEMPDETNVQREMSEEAINDSAALSSDFNSAKISVPNFPKEYKKTVDNLTFDTAIDVSPKIISGTKVTANLHKMDWDAIKAEMFDGIEVKDEQRREAQDIDGHKSQVIYYTGTGEQSLGLYESGFDFSTPFFGAVFHAFDIERNGEKYSTDTQLEFSTTEDAFTDIQEKLKRMGIAIGADPYYVCYSLDYETMKNEEVVLDMFGNDDPAAYKDSWSSEDECYYFSIWQTCNEVVVHSPYSQMINKLGNWNAPIQVMYSKNGIEYIAVGRLYQSVHQNDKVELKSFDEIAQAIIDKYTMIISDANYRVESAKMVYYPIESSDQEYTLTPIWIFEINELTTDENVKGGLFQTAYDACTGMELY